MGARAGSDGWLWIDFLNVGKLVKEEKGFDPANGNSGGVRGFRGSSSVEGGDVNLQRLTRNLYPSGCS